MMTALFRGNVIPEGDLPGNVSVNRKLQLPDPISPPAAVPGIWMEENYCVKSGTSMAAPVVSGAIALLLEKEPHLTNVEIKMRLKNCARNLNLPKHQQGWGMIDVNLLLT